MLRTNLSTRPFYNERAVTLGLVCVALLAGIFTIYNLTTLVTLSRRHTALRAEIASSQRRANELRQQAARVRAAIDPDALAAVSAAAHEANQLIDRRTFSWTELFNTFEATLPADVRISAVKPAIDPGGRFVVSMTVLARRVEDIDAFIEALEKTGRFSGVLSRSERTNEDDMIEAELAGVYVPGDIEPPDQGAQDADAGH
jgi:Tfp pilus assembly protein PilN